MTRTGNRQKEKPTFEDFFVQKDEKWLLQTIVRHTSSQFTLMVLSRINLLSTT
jgi:hypothetical protein